MGLSGFFIAIASAFARLSDSHEIAKRVFESIHQAFDWLPLAALVGDAALVLHGGIGDGTWGIHQLRHEVPRPLRSLRGAPVWVAQALWSDPSDSDAQMAWGVHHNRERDPHLNDPKVMMRFGPCARAVGRDSNVPRRRLAASHAGCAYLHAAVRSCPARAVSCATSATTPRDAVDHPETPCAPSTRCHSHALWLALCLRSALVRGPSTATHPTDCARSLRGGSGGRDVTEAFCRREKVQLVVRSHQYVAEGVKWMHGGRLVTVFSARNYLRGANWRPPTPPSSHRMHRRVVGVASPVSAHPVCPHAMGYMMVAHDAPRARA